MQGTDNSNNVISLFAARKAQTHKENAQQAAEVAVEEAENTVENGPAFTDSIRRNLENSDRLKKERLKANQLVLKSYRIKNN